MLAPIELRLRWHWEGLTETRIVLDYSNAAITYQKERRESSCKVSWLGWKRVSLDRRTKEQTSSSQNGSNNNKELSRARFL